MNLPKLALLSRKTHRLLVVVVVTLGLIMMITGAVMKYPDLVTFIYPFAARQLHGFVCTFFFIVLFVMMATGGFLYLFPWFTKQLSKRTPVQQT